MRDLGLREWTALAALVFGVLVGFVFLDPASGGSEEPLPLRFGDRPTVPPTPTPVTPTPVTPSRLPAPDGWEVTFAIIGDGRETPDSARVVPSLDLAFERAPFPDYRDNSWKVTARASVELGEGSSMFVLRYDAAVRVFINDREMVSRPEPEHGAEELTVGFAHESGRAEIRIEASDEAGPFRLQYEDQ